MTDYRCIFIDWHGTLSTSPFWGPLAAGPPADRERYARLRAALYGPLAALIVPWMRGELTTEVVLRAVAEEVGLPFDPIYADFIDGCRAMTFVSSAIVPLVAALRSRGCRVVIATDNMDAFARWTAPALGLSATFDGLLCSAALGALKGESPDRFFGPTLRAYGLRAGESVLLDDSPRVAAAAGAVGIDLRPITPQQDLTAALRELLA